MAKPDAPRSRTSARRRVRPPAPRRVPDWLVVVLIVGALCGGLLPLLIALGFLPLR